MFTLLSRGFVTVFVLLGLVAPLHAGNSAAAKGCQKVEGQITIQPVDKDCQSCPGQGTIKGDIKGSFSVASTSMLPSNDFDKTYVVFVTSDTTYTTKDGLLYSKDASTLATTGDWDYAEVITITGGTDGYAGATGTLTATGSATPWSGGSGTYTGQICVPGS